MKRWFSVRFRAPLEKRDKPGHDQALEGLRGLCALLVLYAHAFMPGPMLDPHWAPSPRFWWLNLGYAAVLMFFVLSGYVIGLTTQRAATGPNIRRYAVRRAVRLLPIAWVAVLISWAFQPGLPWRTVLGNFLFLQNSEPYPAFGMFPLMPNNANLWSLNYELVYYLGFVFIWCCAPPVTAIFLAMALLVIGQSVGLPVAAVFGRYACGSFYWLAGLAVAWLSEPANDENSKSNWPAALLGAYAIWMIAPLRSVLEYFSCYGWLWPTPVSPHRLDFLPACLWVLLAVTRRTPALQRTLGLGCLGWTTFGLVLHWTTGSGRESDGPAALALLLQCFLTRIDYSTGWLRKLAPVGAISFGIYAISAPIQFRQRDLFEWFSGSGFTFFIRALLMVAGIAGIAWVLEQLLQPKLNRQLAGKTAEKA
jgi:peptidoglycan/LPS O-acetylase OafA/YrhL